MHVVALVLFVVVADLGSNWALSLEKAGRRWNDLLAQSSTESHRHADDIDAHVLARTRGRVNLNEEATTLVDMGAGVFLEVRLAIHVAHAGGARVAFIANYRDEVWEAIRGKPYACVFDDGQTQLAQIYGRERKIAYAKVIVVVCEIPAAVVINECQSVHLQALDVEQTSDHTVQICNNDYVDLAQENHTLTACVPIPYEDPLHLDRSGFLQLPQWLEYNAMHGVDHFVFYLLANFPEHRARVLGLAEPFLRQGAASFVEVDGFSASDVGQSWNDYHSYVANDCLYRMKHRTHWLMATIDMDEYVHFDEGVSDWTAGLKELEESQPDQTLTSVSFGRYQYLLPDSHTQLQITSTKRQDEFALICPKYIVRPENVHSVFIHWPISIVEGAVQLSSSRLWAAHFKLTDETVLEKQIRIVSDDVLISEVENLKNRIVAHYGSAGTEDLDVGLLSRRTVGTRTGITEDEYEEQVAKEPSGLVRRFTKDTAASKHLIFEPPAESEVRALVSGRLRERTSTSRFAG